MSRMTEVIANQMWRILQTRWSGLDARSLQMNWTDLNWTGLQLANWRLRIRTAANQPRMTQTRVTNNASCNWVDLFRSVQFGRGSTIQSGSVDVRSPQHIDAVVPPSPNAGPTTQPQPAIGHYDAVPTFHNDDFCEARLPMLCSGCLEFTTENCR